MTSNTAANTPAPSWRKDWLAWVIIGSIGYSLICFISLATDIQRPFPGFLTYHYFRSEQVQILWNVPSWWWFQDDELPNITDTLISVEGVPFTQLTDMVNDQIIYEELQTAGKQTITLQLQRNNEIHTHEIPLQIFTWQRFVDFALAPFILSGSLLLLAVILYLASGNILVQRIAILLLLAIASIVHSHSSLFLNGQFHDHLIGYNNLINAIAALVLGPLFFHFAVHYPSSIFQDKRLLAKTPHLLYVLAFIALIIYVLSRLTLNIEGISPPVKLFDYIALESVVFLLIIGVSAAMIRLIADGFFRSVHPRAYREARIMLAAFLFALPAFLFAAYGTADKGDTVAMMSSLADPRYFILAVPLAFATITLRYYPNRKLNKWLLFVWTLTTSAILANIVLIMLFYKNPAEIGNYAIPPTLLLLVAFLIIGLITNWQNSWQGWLGRLFNWERVNYRAVQQFGHELATQSTTDISQLAQNIVTALCQELSLECAACWLAEGYEMQLTAINGRLPTNTPDTLYPSPDLGDQPIRLTKTIPNWLQPLAAKATVVLPLTISGKPLGLIAVGQRWDAPIFDDRDLEILALISQQAALMLHNTQQTAQLRQTDQQLLHIQKLTRQKTAQNLHDHILPALSQLQMKLLTANQLIDSQPQNAQKILNESQESLRENAKLVRRIQKDLVIRPLEYGLAPYLQELVNQFQQDTGIPVAVDLPTALDTTVTDISIRETIYAVWQQALDNIYQHAQATAVTITLSLDNTQLTFSICDNGRGSLPKQQEEALKNGHFGLRSMQIRLQSVGGQFTFQSTPDQGSCVQGQIPLSSVQ